MNIEKLTVKQICNCIAVINKMTEEKLIKFNPNKACVQFNYDKITRYLEDQNIEQQKQLKAYENMRKDAIQQIKDTCIEQIPDMPKGCYRSIASEQDLLDLLNILNKVGGSDE